MKRKPGKSAIIIGKPFRTKLEGMVKKNIAVCECACGKIYVTIAFRRKGKLEPRTKFCDKCNPQNLFLKPGWQTHLNEHVIRMQNWYQDRRGRKICINCKKPRKLSQYNAHKLCRECLALESTKSILEVTTSRIKCGPRYSNDDTSPSWDNMIRMIEDN